MFRMTFACGGRFKKSLRPDGVDTALADPAMRDPVARGGGGGGGGGW
jgi:hypothetical protein